ncbi:hypothetical protein [Kitasatospora aureofaciens]|uniref:hypothetical protein n=1 Tax=Kitasatospora aureofaciens TaxID=1894 RepID=UPI001C449DB8|nr:hypothetical protein [Kitasatospora aureofaciens]MBV6703467.1 hypothetical protein [Kitasatospora aureofaciens]
MKRRLIAKVTVTLAIAAASLSPAAPAQAVIASVFDVIVLTNQATEVGAVLDATTNGATENISARVVALGVDVGDTTGQQAGNGTRAIATFPITTPLGRIDNGVHPVVTITGTETVGGAQVSTSTTATTLTCDLDSNGNGVCQ